GISSLRGSTSYTSAAHSRRRSVFAGSQPPFNSRAEFQISVSHLREYKFCQKPYFAALISTTKMSTFKSIASPFPSGFLSFGLVAVNILSSIILPAFTKVGCAQIEPESAAPTPTRDTRTPTATAIYQDKASFGFLFCMIIVTISLSVSTGALWVRSPNSSRLSRDCSPPPPPPPPPPLPAPLNGNGNTEADDANQEHNGGGDEDPQEDDAEDGANPHDGDGLLVAGAPAPEDPPPPPDGVEQEDDEDNIGNSATDSGLLWFLLLLFGRLAMALATQNRSTSTSSSSEPPVLNLPAVARPQSTTIPGLLQRQQFIEVDHTLDTCAAPSPPSLIAGLLWRQPPPVPHVEPAAVVDPPLPVQHPRDVLPPRASTSVGPPSRQRHLAIWRKVYITLAALPGISVVVAVLYLLLAPRGPPQEADAQPEPPVDQPAPPLALPAPPALPPPPPSRQEAGAKLVTLLRRTTAIRIEQRDTQGPEDATTHAERLREVQRQICQTAAVRTARPEAPKEEVAVENEADPERVRLNEIRVLQRRIWRLLVELVEPQG
ncbi:hypothetical protein DFH07DRAFT_1007666, partial [Mycena maculata]